jgi:hypothetical protein
MNKIWWIKIIVAKGIYKVLYISNVLYYIITARQIPYAVYRVLNSWWLAEEPPETCRVFIIINTIVWRCILLVLLLYIKDAQSHERKKNGDSSWIL